MTKAAAHKIANGQTCLSLEINKALVASSLRVSDLHKKLAADGYKVSVNHLSDLSHSDRIASPELLNAIAKALRMTRDLRQRMHRAAALDRGYDVGSL